MATYQLVGSQDPAGRIDRIEVERPSEDFPDGKVLLLNGPAVELSDDQYSKLSAYARLQPADAEEGEVAPVVDQPGVNLPSRSTDPLTNLDVESATKEELAAVVPDADPKANKGQLQDAVRRRRGEEPPAEPTSTGEGA